MIISAPSRRGFGQVATGSSAASPGSSDFSAWYSSGHNDGGRILAHVVNGGNPGTPQEPGPFAAEVGKSVPNGGGWVGQGGRPVIIVFNDPLSSGMLYLDAPGNYGTPPLFQGSWFKHPGDDVMRAAIAKWILPYVPDWWKASHAAAPVVLPSSTGALVPSGAPARASTQPATVATSGGIPGWAWLVGALAVGWFFLRGSDGG